MIVLNIPIQEPIDSWLADFISQANRPQDSECYQLLYIGGDWCAPCKALKPIVEAKVETIVEAKLERKYTLQAYEVNLDETFDLTSSRLITALPCLLLIHQSKIEAQLSGMIEASALNALLAKVQPLDTLAMDEDDELEAQGIVEHIHYLITQNQIKQAHEYYLNLPSITKYLPRVQQIKSLIDLVELSAQQAAHPSKPIRLACSHFMALDIEQGLDCLLAQAQQPSASLARDLYVLAINTLINKAQASYYRRQLLQR